MSLTTLINGEFKDFFKEVIPSKKEFKTFSGKSAFSKEYVQYAEYKLKNPYNSTIVGTIIFSIKLPITGAGFFCSLQLKLLSNLMLLSG